MSVQPLIHLLFSFCEGKRNQTQKRGQKYTAIQLLTTGQYRIVTDLRKGYPVGHILAVLARPFQKSNSWLNDTMNLI